MTIALTCLNCKNRISVNTCLAFPKQIPAEILDGINNHTRAVKGDNGIRFEPMDNQSRKIVTTRLR